MTLTMHKKFDRQNTAIRKSKVKHPLDLQSHPLPRSLKYPVSKMDILRQSLQKIKFNTIQATPSTIPSTTPLRIPSDSPDRQRAQIPIWVVESNTMEKRLSKI